MELKWLRTFLLTAELKNYRKVADALYMTQPAVSAQMKQLEQTIGAPLFRKEGRHITLTAFGAKFVEEAKGLLRVYEDMIHRTNLMKQGYHSSLSIAMTPLLVDSVFPTILRKFAEENPKVELEIMVSDSKDMQELVEESKVDVALSCLPPTSIHVHSLRLLNEPVSLVISHDGWDEESAPWIEADEILAKNIIFTDHHPLYWPNLKRQIQNQVSTYRFVKVSQSHAAKRFILEGMGISFLPLFTARREIQEGRLLPVSTPFLDLPMSSIYALYTDYDTKTELFVKFIKQFKTG